ncbi:ankyrin repeat domain-containing protein [Planctomycetota bacterium]
MNAKRISILGCLLTISVACALSGCASTKQQNNDAKSMLQIRTHYEQAQSFYADRLWKQSIDALDRALDLDPKYEPALALRDAAKLSQASAQSRFAVIGRLKRSHVYASTSIKRYRIVDESGRIICYVSPTGAIVDKDFTKFFGRKVGLVGQIQPNQTTGGALVAFTEIVPMEAGADVNTKGKETGEINKLKRASVYQSDADKATVKLKVLSESMDAIDIVQIRKLITDGADVNITNKHGVTPLLKASHNGHTEVVKLLLESGANVDATDTNGSTSLILASMRGHSEIVKLLLEANADVNIALPDGSPPPGSSITGGAYRDSQTSKRI